MLMTILGTSVLFSIGGLINAIFARSFEDISIIPSFVLTPLTYLGGVFYSLDNLSSFWQNLSLLNPIVYMVNAFRFGILGHSDVNVLVVADCNFGILYSALWLGVSFVGQWVETKIIIY